MTTPIPRPEAEIRASGRLAALDSLRGLAAMIVVFDHLLLTYGWSHYLEHFGLRLLIAGPGAVVLFFVLSGMVLAKTFVDKDRYYAPYIIKRLARVYLPFAAVTIVAASLSWKIGQAPLSSATIWFNDYGWRNPVDLDLVLSHLRMDGSGIELNNASWSLIHEMRLAIAVPLIAVAMRRNWKLTLATAWGIAVASGVYQRLHVAPLMMPWWANTVIYAALFANGAALALAGQPLLTRLYRLHGAIQATLIFSALIILSTSQIGLFSIWFNKAFIALFLQAAAATFIIAFAMIDCWMTRTILNHPIPIYLGRISYSLYLVHLVVLQVLVRLLEGRVPNGITIPLVLVVSIAVAHILRETLEAGSQSLGRWLARKVSRDPLVSDGGFGRAG
jgi:peptidoglycan/LPS O-acetylase OafA/YrhL